MLLIEKIEARIPGLQNAAEHGILVPTRHIVDKLSPKAPSGKDVSPDFIERHLGIKTVALSRHTHDFLERHVWLAAGRPFGELDREYRLQARGGIVNQTLMNLLSECMEKVIPKGADHAKLKRHIHLSLAPPTDMDRHMGLLRRQHGLSEDISTEYVTIACPSLPAVLLSLQRTQVSTEMLCLVTGDHNMLPFMQQYASLTQEDRGNINRWLYVAAFGEATGAALVRLCPETSQSDHEGWEVVSVGIDSVPSIGPDEWRGAIAPDGAMDIDVKNVVSTYRSAMQKQVPIALNAIARRHDADVSSTATAIQSLHAFCFHESNFLLLTEMAQAHSIPKDLVPHICDRSGSLVGMSIFVSLSEALRTWEELHAAGRRPKNAVAASVVGQAGINVACGHIVLQATPALQQKSNNSGTLTPAAKIKPLHIPLTEAYVRKALEPLSNDGDMREFLQKWTSQTVKWQIMGHTKPLCETYSPAGLLAHWDRLMLALQPNKYRLHIDNILVDADARTAIAEMHGDALLGDSSGRYQQSYCWIMTFDDDGRIRAVRAYLDTSVATKTVFAS